MANKRGGGWIFAIILGPIVMLIGFAIAYFIGLPMIREARASETWPTTPGRVTTSEVRSSYRDGKSMYSHIIEYRYTVNDRQHIGDRVWIGPTSSSSSSKSADRLAATYPVGQDVEVHYNSEDHAASALHAGATFSTYIFAIVGGVFFFIGFCVTAVLVFKIVAGIFLVGAAATSFASDTSQSTSFSSHSPPGSSSPPSSDDDGIGIG